MAVKGAYDKVTLPNRIRSMEDKLAIPLWQNQDLALPKRYVFIRSIREASLLRRLESVRNADEALLVKQRHFQIMRQELEMNKVDLNKQPATKADIAILGLALQEVALCLDDHVNAFKQSGENAMEHFKTQSNNAVDQQKALQKQGQKQMNELIQQFQTGLENLRSKSEAIVLSHRETEAKLNANLNKSLQEFERRQTARWYGLSFVVFITAVIFVSILFFK